MKKLILISLFGLVLLGCKEEVRPSIVGTLKVQFISYDEGIDLVKKYDSNFVSEQNYESYAARFTVLVKSSIDLTKYKVLLEAPHDLEISTCMDYEGAPCGQLIKKTKLLGEWQKQPDGSYSIQGIGFVGFVDSRYKTINELNSLKFPNIRGNLYMKMIMTDITTVIPLIAIWKP